jgi:hypothetical protein
MLLARSVPQPLVQPLRRPLREESAAIIIEPREVVVGDLSVDDQWTSRHRHQHSLCFERGPDRKVYDAPGSAVPRGFMCHTCEVSIDLSEVNLPRANPLSPTRRSRHCSSHPETKFSLRGVALKIRD